MCRSRLTTPRSSAARFSLFRSASSTPPWYLRARTVADRKSTRLNSSHLVISYAAFRFKKKLLAVRAAELAGDATAAAESHGGSDEPAPPPARVLGLLGAGRREEAVALLDTITYRPVRDG